MDHLIIRSLSPLTAGRWQTLDPFLFCVYHNDHYPAGKDDGSPQASLAGRTIGSDFSGKDGWSMYHGQSVPGFPQHPHRGFETISIVRRGLIDHSDSLGATARIGAGDIQWMTAGAGIVHAEMFPLIHADQNNPTDFFQLWLNLPSARKMSPPDFKMFWHEEVPRVNLIDGQGQSSVVTVIAGPFGEQIPLSPPSASWAADAQAELAIWLIDMSAGAEINLPPQPLGAHRVIYHVEGSNVKIGGATLKPRHGALMFEGYPHEVQAQQSSATLLVLQGRPIGEPVAQRGPFVMNTVDELRQAVYDYQRTQFGGWPWSRPDPVHDRKSGRFARYIDGREHRPPSSETQRGKHHITK
jgi:redox-sensitive bicupin YhaK (pirin superfamily)